MLSSNSRGQQVKNICFREKKCWIWIGSPSFPNFIGGRFHLRWGGRDRMLHGGGDPPTTGNPGDPVLTPLFVEWSSTNTTRP